MAEYEVKVVSVGESDMHYTVFGHGPKTLVILPGVSVTPVYFSAAGIATAFAEFEDDYTVYVFDRIDDLKPGHLTEEMAEDTVRAIKALGLKDIYLFGTSHGGMMAQYVAEEYPELVKKLAVCSTLPRQNETSRKTFAKWVELAGKDGMEELNRDINLHVYAPWYYKKFEAVFKELEKVGTAHDRERFGIMSEACLEFNRFDELKKIKCPTAVFGAWEDSVLGYEGSIEIAQALACPLVIKSAYGHAVYDENAGLKGEVKKFFDEEYIGDAI